MSRPLNPYIAGAPLRGDRGFFGRGDTLAWVEEELRNQETNALVLSGQRRIGKTSLLLQLQRNLPQESFLPVYFDLQDQATHPLGKVLFDLADKAADKTGEDLLDSLRVDNRGRFFRRAFLPKLYNALGESIRPVFLLDEFDVLDKVAEADLALDSAAKALFPFLRSVMAEERRPAFVFVVGRRAEDLSLDFTSTFKASLSREIWVLDEESAETLVRQAEANESLKFTRPAVTRILEITNRHPYLTQLLCQRIWQRAYQDSPADTPQVSLKDVTAAVPDALAAGEQALIWLWNGLSPAEKIYAAALAEVSQPDEVIPEDQVIRVLSEHAARLRTREVELAPRDLVIRKVIEEAGEKEYRFAVELFRLWLQKNRPLRDVKEELDRVDPLADQMFGVGRSHFSRRNWSAAIRYFEDALESNGRHFGARLLRGESLLELNRIEEAVEDLEQAYELDRNESRLSLARALVAQSTKFLEESDDEQALQASQRALEISPNEIEARRIATEIWTRRGDQALTSDDLEAALAAYKNAGNTEKTAQVEEMQIARTLAPLEAQGRTLLIQEDQWQAAAEVYEKLIAEAPDLTDKTVWQDTLVRIREELELSELFDEGVEALARKQWQQARESFQHVLSRRIGYQRRDQTAAQLLHEAIIADPSLPPSFAVPDLIFGPSESPEIVAVPDTDPAERDVIAAPADPVVGAAEGKEVVLEGHNGLVLSVVFSPDGQTLASSASDRVIRLWDITQQTTLQTLEGHSDWVLGLAYSPDGELLISGSSDQSVKVWELPSGRRRRTLRVRGFQISDLDFSPDGKMACAASSDGSIRVWDTNTWKQTQKLTGHSEAVRQVSFSPNGAWLGSAADDNTWMLWKIEGWQLEQTLRFEAARIVSIDFSPDGARLATGFSDGKIIEWELPKGKQLQVLQQPGKLTTIAYSPDGMLLAAGSADNSVSIWRLTDGKLIDHLRGHIGTIRSVCFSPRGDLLASGSHDKTIRLWSLTEQ